MKLGLFGGNVSGGGTGGQADCWTADWDDNVTIAELADSEGLDFLLSINRWKGYGGKKDPMGTSLESLAWSAGILAKTKQINVFATVQSTLLHPVIAAKQFVTADHIGGGRLGINVVAGWNESEFKSLGVTVDREDRYPYSREWIDCIKQIWSTSEEHDFIGQYFQFSGLRNKPGPYGGSRPMLINAGMSEVGRTFALENCDALFCNYPEGGFDELATTVAEVKSRAQGRGVPYPVFTHGKIICRATTHEAEEYDRNFKENLDWDAIDNMSKVRAKAGLSSSGRTLEERRAFLSRGLGDFTVVGDPDLVASQIARLSESGIDGLGISFLDPINDLPFFLQEVNPRLKRLGVRV